MAYNNDTLALFPNRFVVSKAHEVDWYDDLIHWIEEYQQTHKGVEVSNVGGYQSRGNFYTEDDSFEPFRQKIWQHIEDAVGTYTDGIELYDIIASGDSLRLMNIWFNVNTPGAFNHVHVHPGSLLSGVLWIKTPKGSGDLMFRDPSEMNNYCLGVNCVAFPPKEGTMILFPSHVPHNVGVNESEETRISLSFNLDFG
jgi:uncharacterized protein (TIGR02466 family)